jgi:rod shape-determining protein MreD
MLFKKRDYDPGHAESESIMGMLQRWVLMSVQVFFLIGMSVFPFKFLHFGDVRPAFLLMAVYHWSVFRPQALSPPAAFCAGIVLDLLCAGPPGLNALTLVGMQRLTGIQRKFLSGQSFLVLWLCFALMALGAFAFQWAISSLLEWHLVPPRPMLMSAGLTALFFPTVAWLLGLFHKTLSSRPASMA